MVKVRTKEKDGYCALQIGAFNHPKADKKVCGCGVWAHVAFDLSN